MISIEQGSPAEKEGVQLGEEVVQVNGEPVRSYTIPELRELFVTNEDARRVELVIRRDEREQAVVLDKAYVFD